MVELWVEKYSPKSLVSVIGQDASIERMRSWAEAWKRGEPQKPLLLHGQAGVGKTTSILALADDYNFELLELNASDVRNADKINHIAGVASVASTFSGKMRMILFDEIDGLMGNEDRGGAAAISKIIKEAQCPLIFTANDYYDQKLAGIKVQCEDLKFQKVRWNSIAKWLEKICVEEGVSVSKEVITELAKNCGGDFRSATNDLQMIAAVGTESFDISAVKRDREESMFNVMGIIFGHKSFYESRRSLDGVDEQPDFVLKWVDENVFRAYTKKEDLFRAYEAVSRADIFLGHVSKRQNYTFWKYASDMMTAGVSLAKDEEYHSWTRYAFPSFIKGLSASKGSRGKRKVIALKIAKKVHVSSSTVIQDYMPMIEQLMKEKPEELVLQFGFDEDDLDYFGLDKVVLKKAEELRERLISEQMKKPVDEKQKGLDAFF